MSILLSIMIGLIIVLAVLLTLVVLAQNPKGGGLSSAFGGAGSSQLMGVKRTNDLLEKVTWGFAIAIMVLCVSTGFIVNSNTAQPGMPNSVNIERAGDMQAPALPGTGDSTAVFDDAGDAAQPADEAAEGDTSNPFWSNDARLYTKGALTQEPLFLCPVLGSLCCHVANERTLGHGQ